jgi:hypothetical protein
MSYPNDAPAAAWYPDPQTSGQVRWWDGTNWTQHVSKSAEPAEQLPAAAVSIAAQLAAPIVPQVAEADAAFAAADEEARVAPVTYIGRHAAGATPAPRQASSAPRIRPRVRVEVAVEALAYA